MPAGLDWGRRVEQGSDVRPGGGRVRHHQRRRPGRHVVPQRIGHDHGAGPAVRECARVPRVPGEGNLLRPGRLQRRQAMDHDDRTGLPAADRRADHVEVMRTGVGEVARVSDGRVHARCLAAFTSAAVFDDPLHSMTHFDRQSRQGAATMVQDRTTRPWPGVTAAPSAPGGPAARGAGCALGSASRGRRRPPRCRARSSAAARRAA